MQTYLIIAQMVLSVALVFSVLFQVKGGGLGGIFGQADTVYGPSGAWRRRCFRLPLSW